MFFFIFLRSEEAYVSKWFILLWQLQSKIAVNVPLLSRQCIYKQKGKPSKFIPGFGSPPANTFRCQYTVLYCLHAKVNVKQRCLCHLLDIPQSLLLDLSGCSKLKLPYFWHCIWPELHLEESCNYFKGRVLRLALEFGFQLFSWWQHLGDTRKTEHN